MNKEELIDLVKLNVSGGDASAELKSRYSPQEIEKYLEMIFDDLIYQTYISGYKYGDFSQVDNYMQTYVFAVKYDAEREQYYVILDPQPLPLPENFSIRQVSPPKDQPAAFAPVDNVSDSVFSILEVNTVSSKPGYSVEGNRIWFDDKFPKHYRFIMVKQIVSFSSLKDTDSVFVPGGNNTHVVQMVLAIMLGKPMPDIQGSNQNANQK